MWDEIKKMVNTSKVLLQSEAAALSAGMPITDTVIERMAHDLTAGVTGCMNRITGKTKSRGKVRPKVSRSQLNS